MSDLRPFPMELFGDKNGSTMREKEERRDSPLIDLSRKKRKYIVLMCVNIVGLCHIMQEAGGFTVKGGLRIPHHHAANGIENRQIEEPEFRPQD